MPTPPLKPRQYPLYRARGAHRELGRQHGEQAAERIEAHIDFLARTQKLSLTQLHTRALRFQPLFRQHCPHLLDEIEGLAEGARISLAEALAVNIRGVLAQAEPEGCTAFVIGPRGTTDGTVLIGQNSDIGPPIIDLAYVLHLQPPGKPEVLFWTFGGMIGYHGLNDAGVAHFANDLGDGGPRPRFALPHYPVKRLMLECQCLDEVVELLRKMPLAVNGNYVLCDGGGQILDVEATSAGPELVRDDGVGFLAHSNHFVAGALATPENHRQCVADSFPRLERMNALIREKFGTITVEDVKGFLADHANHPRSICRHPESSDFEKGFETAGQTVASLVAEPAQGRLHVALGNPCAGTFVEYAMG